MSDYRKGYLDVRIICRRRAHFKKSFFKSLVDEMAKIVCLCNGTTEGVQNIHALEYDLFIYSRNQSSAGNVISVYEKTSDPFLSISKIELRIENKKVIRFGISAFIDSN